ncbi:MAG: hypothetical protein IKD33_01315 [Bacteroidales bacterium]|nr:hypothetical protein [Bacteroidales bacterium]
MNYNAVAMASSYSSTRADRRRRSSHIPRHPTERNKTDKVAKIKEKLGSWRMDNPIYALPFVTLRFSHQKCHSYGPKLWHFWVVNRRVMTKKRGGCFQRTLQTSFCPAEWS